MTFRECIVEKQMMQLHVDIQDAEEGILKSVEPLIQAGCCLPEYGPSIIETYRDIGAYFVLTDGFAIPHSRPENGVLGIGFSLLTFKTPVNFNSDQDPIKVLLSICATDSESHLEGIEIICELLEKDDIVDKLWAANSPEEIIKLIEI